jgi:hypothetical protein
MLGKMAIKPLAASIARRFMAKLLSILILWTGISKPGWFIFLPSPYERAKRIREVQEF